MKYRSGAATLPSRLRIGTKLRKSANPGIVGATIRQRLVGAGRRTNTGCEIATGHIAARPDINGVLHIFDNSGERLELQTRSARETDGFATEVAPIRYRAAQHRTTYIDYDSKTMLLGGNR